MRSYTGAIIFCSLLSWLPAFTQVVWPGDVNNNGTVNGVDVLYWGIAFGSSGPARADASTAWQGVPLLSLWEQRFPDGLNYAYADCNGDGIVDDDDLDDAIEDNFGLMHGTILPDGYQNGVLGTAPRLRLQPDVEIASFGTTVNIGLYLDDSDMPLADFYGVAMLLSYTPNLLDADDGLDFDIAEDSWIEADNSQVEDIFEGDEVLGRAELAITRTNQRAVPVGPGEIGRFSIVIEDIIVGREIDTFRLRIDSVFLINERLELTPIVPDTALIIITKDPKVTAVTSTPPSRPPMKIFPNPASAGSDFYLESNTSSLHELKLIDQLGRVWPMSVYAVQEGIYRLNASGIPPGIYWLSAYVSGNLIGQKIIFF